MAANLEVKITGDSSDFSAVAKGVVKTAKTAQDQIARAEKERQTTVERWIKRERELNGMSAKERLQQTAMRGRLEQNHRNIQARALRRERAESREPARAAAMPPKITGRTAKGGGELTATFGAAFAIAKANEFVHALDTMVERILSVSESLGVSTKFFQGWEFAAGQSNVKTKTANSGLEKLSINLGKAQEGSAAAAAAFKRYGLEIYSAGGGLKTVEQILLEVSDAMQGADNDAQRTSMAVALMGENGSKIIPMLKGGSEELQRMMDKARILSAQDAKIIDEFSDEFTTMKAEFMASSGAVVAGFLRMTVAAMGFKDALSKSFSGNGDDDLKNSIKSIVGLLAFVFPALAPITSMLGRGSVPAPGEQNGPFLPTPASDDALAARDAALEAFAQEGETSEEKLKRLNQEYEKAQHEMSNMWPGSAGQVSKETQAIGIAQEIKALEIQMSKDAAQEKDEPFVEPKNPLNIKGGQLSNVGGFSAGMTPGMVNDILGWQQLTEQQKAVRHLSELVRISRSTTTERAPAWD